MNFSERLEDTAVIQNERSDMDLETSAEASVVGGEDIGDTNDELESAGGPPGGGHQMETQEELEADSDPTTTCLAPILINMPRPDEWPPIIPRKLRLNSCAAAEDFAAKNFVDPRKRPLSVQGASRATNVAAYHTDKY